MNRGAQRAPEGHRESDTIEHTHSFQGVGWQKAGVWLLFTEPRLILRNPTNCRTPGFPVLLYLPEFAQTHIHRVGLRKTK